MTDLIKCTPYADENKCKFRIVLDGEEWCFTHEAYRWRPQEWRDWNREQAEKKEKVP